MSKIRGRGGDAPGIERDENNHNIVNGGIYFLKKKMNKIKPFKYVAKN
jgi:hypothetical protein